jgi:hypothetical protein
VTQSYVRAKPRPALVRQAASRAASRGTGAEAHCYSRPVANACLRPPFPRSKTTRPVGGSILGDRTPDTYQRARISCAIAAALQAAPLCPVVPSIRIEEDLKKWVTVAL